MESDNDMMHTRIASRPSYPAAAAPVPAQLPTPPAVPRESRVSAAPRVSNGPAPVLLAMNVGATSPPPTVPMSTTTAPLALGIGGGRPLLKTRMIPQLNLLNNSNAVGTMTTTRPILRAPLLGGAQNHAALLVNRSAGVSSVPLPGNMLVGGGMMVHSGPNRPGQGPGFTGKN